jgi:hypothetical protein
VKEFNASLERLVAEVDSLHRELGEIKSEIERRRRIEAALELERDLGMRLH